MPTNILRARSKKAAVAATIDVARELRHVLIRAGDVEIRVRLLDTPTAAKIWQALPIRSTAEMWGEELFFETTVEAGRERTARTIVTAGQIAFSPDRDVIAIAFGRTPSSKSNEARLWAPSNIWGEALDDVRQLARVTPGARVDVTALSSSPSAEVGGV